ncbi:MAG: type II toxin-antitoxin system prevent-host-death family antitoxin [Verrucomicrobia bacterium]|nr:type II toxin-antitoxin system prevent-host-death family antitoxin [Verrucomicrobiota bacterium]
MKHSTPPVRYSKVTSEVGKSGVVLREVAGVEPQSTSINVRAAKDQLSSLLEQASRGVEIIITSDGHPKARLVPVRSHGKPYSVDWKWLSDQPLVSGPSAEALLRIERDGRD